MQLYCGDCLEILPEMPDGCVDAVVTDPPYSSRTHASHNASVNGHLGAGKDTATRKPLAYASMDRTEVYNIVTECHRVCIGWLVFLTDHVLAPLFQSAAEHTGRYVFAPLPWYSPGSRCRLSGDGPSSWTVWIVVSRTTKQHKWGTLPGGYLVSSERSNFTGAKPIILMVRLCRDYSRQGDSVLDPFMGSGTTGVACVKLGRKFIGIEKEPKYFDIACKRIQDAIDDGALFAPLEEKQEPEAGLFDANDHHV